MHIFAADIYPLCDFDLKYYDTSCSNLEQKKIDHKPNKDEALEREALAS